jgi:hypothetical protein
VSLCLSQAATLTALSALVMAGCGGERAQPDAMQRDAGAVDAGERTSKVAEAPALRPAFDEQGVPLPHPKALALGTPFPQGFERIQAGRGESVYKGPIEPEKVFRFYQRYLECAEVIAGAKGWQFKRATPKAPGDTSRAVEVTVIKRSRKISQVVVVDRMGRGKIGVPEGKIQTHEELFEAAHKGVGSSRNPIPGTY